MLNSFANSCPNRRNVNDGSFYIKLKTLKDGGGKSPLAIELWKDDGL
jgi:hypothetical protein